MEFYVFFSSRRRHTRYWRDWSSDVCSSDLAGLEAVGVGREHPHGGDDPGGDVGERRRAFRRRAVRPVAGDAHDAAHRLGDEVEAAAVLVGTGAAEARERAVDQAGVVLPEVLVAEA